MHLFTWGDSVIVRDDAPKEFRPGAAGSVVGVIDEPLLGPGETWEFGPGTVYLVEFETDAEAIHIHEDNLRPA